ncbi:hypothetical protein CBA19CS22_16175 [Caballeronia novacaledonica]|uniref:Uncharacterized protein n=1 Tax=Caballeronia novacaledonica TaxID=1544861 RepID=A0ACB5QSD2_9BURK|nr:hypothetical protein CBA19CS22_16175 [Caballeronia novacaledonica]
MEMHRAKVDVASLRTVLSPALPTSESEDVRLQRVTLDLPAMGRFSIKVSLQLLETAMKFEVKDMSCGGCANAITQAITQEDAAASVAIDVSGKVVEVESAASQERLMAAIEAAGFHPTVLAS